MATADDDSAIRQPNEIKNKSPMRVTLFWESDLSSFRKENHKNESRGHKNEL